jgi:hypothetical protein
VISQKKRGEGLFQNVITFWNKLVNFLRNYIMAMIILDSEVLKFGYNKLTQLEKGGSRPKQYFKMEKKSAWSTVRGKHRG